LDTSFSFPLFLFFYAFLACFLPNKLQMCIKLWMKLSWWHVEMEKPWYDKCKNHTSKQKIQETMAVPKSLSFCCRSSCWERGWCGSIVIVTYVLRWFLICTVNISRYWMTNFTGPVKNLTTEIVRKLQNWIEICYGKW
jgi:hypothetical protein